MKKMTYIQLINYLKEHEGGTFNPKTLQPVKVRKGFCVSLENYEEKNANLFHLFSMLNKYRKIAIKKRAYIGFWLFGGDWYLDISKILKNKNHALKVGKKNNQKAIYQIEKDTNIFIKY